MATAEQGDMGEDAKTTILIGSDGKIRSLACSLTNKWNKLKEDANKIKKKRSDIEELIFATPRTIVESIQEKWKKKIYDEYGWKLIVIEYSEIMALLERPEAKWIREQYLQISDIKDDKPLAEDSPNALNDAAGKLWETGANKEALALYESAHQMAITQRNPLPACHALLGAACCKIDSRDISEAYGLAITAKNIAVEADSSHYRASADVICARIALIQNNLNDAESFAQYAIENGKKAKSRVEDDGQAIMAEIALAQRDGDKALKYLNIGYKRDIKNGGRRAIAAMGLRAAIHLTRQNPKLAVKAFEKAAEKAHEIGNLKIYANYLGKAQRVLVQAGSFRAALNRSKKCEMAAKTIENMPLLLEMLITKSYAYQQLRKNKEARNVIEKIAAITKTNNSYHDIAARALIGLAQILRNEGNLHEGSLVAKQAVECALASNQSYIVGLAYLEICEQDLEGFQYDSAKDAYQKAVENLRMINLPEDIKTGFWIDIAKTNLRVLEGLGNYKKAIEELDILVSGQEFNDDFQKEWYKHKRNELTGKIQWFDTTKKLLNEKQPLRWAQTEGASSLQEAHRWVLGILLDWWDGTMGGSPSPCGVYSLWGEANYGRLLLNHRAFNKSANRPFHLCVEIQSVIEARLACRMLIPLCDCLTLLWKGKMNPGNFMPVPVPFNFETPIRGWKPRPSEYWNSGTRAYRTMLLPINILNLPYSIVKFYLNEARDLVASGRLLLVPGPMVGCIGTGYKDTEDMFCTVAGAEPIIRTGSFENERLPLEMAVPWFPSIPLRDLAKLCEDYDESLIELRQKCLEWSGSIQNNKERALTKIRNEIALLSRDVGRTFQRLSEKGSKDSQLALDSAKGFGCQSNRNNIQSSPIRCESNNRMNAFLESDLHEHMWFPFWSFEQRGLKMELGGSLKPIDSASNVPRGAIVNGDIFHWLKAPGEFSSCFMSCPKDEEFSDAMTHGHIKMYETKGGKISKVTEVPPIKKNKKKNN